MENSKNQALDKMRLLFESKNGHGLELNDETYLRYLRARNFDVKKSSEMLDNTIEWRKNFGLEDIHTGWKDTIEKENSTGKMYVRGFDLEDHVIIYMKPAKENTRDHDGNMKNLVYTMERAIATMNSKENKQEKLSLIIDYEGFSLSNSPPMKTSRETLSILQDHYPERLHRAYLIKPPFIFYAFYRVISPFIDPITKDKICMLTSSDMQNQENRLYKDIHKDSLEICVGGNDERDFCHKIYLDSPFHYDFNKALEITSNEK